MFVITCVTFSFVYSKIMHRISSVMKSSKASSSHFILLDLASKPTGGWITFSLVCRTGVGFWFKNNVAMLFFSSLSTFITPFYSFSLMVFQRVYWLFYKQHFYKQHLAKISQKLTKC